jgi:hypothetical protein
MATISLSAIRLGAVSAAAADAAFVSYITGTVFPEEGGYSNDPNDSGGETNKGITVAVARECGYTGDMADMTDDEALAIYRAHDWHSPGLDQLALVNLALALALLDLGINVGDATAVKFLQTLLQGLGYYSGRIDGQIGNMSCSGVVSFLQKRGDDGLRVLYCGVHAAAGMRYLDIVSAQPKDEEYIYGWLSARAYPNIVP